MNVLKKKFKNWLNKFRLTRNKNMPRQRTRPNPMGS